MRDPIDTAGMTLSAAARYQVMVAETRRLAEENARLRTALIATRRELGLFPQPVVGEPA